MNIPLKAGLTGEAYLNLIQTLLPRLISAYKPEAIVVQCGVDGLANDPLVGTGDLCSQTSKNNGDGWNVNVEYFGAIVRHILEYKKPALLLGGGGYHSANAARCWTYLTSVALATEISSDIPEHEYYTEYMPETILEIPTANIPNKNQDQYIQEMLEQSYSILDQIK